jgi:hypothetical protein
MIRVIVSHPYVKGLGQRPSDSYEYDTQEEADYGMKQMREAGITEIEHYEMSDSEIYNHNVGVHCPNGY